MDHRPGGDATRNRTLAGKCRFGGRKLVYSNYPQRFRGNTSMGKKTGMNVIIEPLFGTVTVFEPHFSEDQEDLELIAFFGSKVRKNFDFKEDKEKPLFKKALKKLGPLNSDEIYAF
jgi:hypothetical protein